MIVDATKTEKPPQSCVPVCAEWSRLLNEYLESIAEILELQFTATVEAGSQTVDAMRFAALQRRAERNKQRAKTTFVRHIQHHHC